MEKMEREMAAPANDSGRIVWTDGHLSGGDPWTPAAATRPPDATQPPSSVGGAWTLENQKDLAALVANARATLGRKGARHYLVRLAQSYGDRGLKLVSKAANVAFSALVLWQAEVARKGTAPSAGILRLEEAEGRGPGGPAAALKAPMVSRPGRAKTKIPKRKNDMWQRLGRPEDWRLARAESQDARARLNDYWASHGVAGGREQAILTNKIHQEWFGLDVQRHKGMKRLTPHHNLRDHMTEAELVFVAHAERVTLQCAMRTRAFGFDQNVAAVGQAADGARLTGKEMGMDVVSGESGAL
jgi:hypothetical protein